MTDKIEGVLEIDAERGVIYFHVGSPDSAERFGAETILRVCQVPSTLLQPNTVIDFAYNNQARSVNEAQLLKKGSRVHYHSYNGTVVEVFANGYAEVQLDALKRLSTLKLTDLIPRASR